MVLRKISGSDGGAGQLPAYPLVYMDERVVQDHAIGALPCPANPPPPEGWVYWAGAAGPALTQFAVGVLQHYPMGTVVMDLVGGELIGARVEWHTVQGATGKTGCFKGVNLLRRVA